MNNNIKRRDFIKQSSLGALAFAGADFSSLSEVKKKPHIDVYKRQMTILMLIFNDYDMVYSMISWLSWIPNLIIAYWINKKQASASRINELVLLK